MTPSSATTFVIATRDRAPELIAVLLRLLDTTPCPIVVVDNASSDDSVGRATQLGHTSGGRLRVVPLQRNVGAVARNIGVTQAETPFIAFCDDDSWWESAAIPAAEGLFARHATVGLLAGRTVVEPDRGDDPMVAELAASPLGHVDGLPGPSILGFLACTSIVRRTAFLGVGGFSPILEFRGEERLLAWDLAAAGWDICFCPQLVAHHRPSVTRPSDARQRARAMRNDVLTTWLRRPVGDCLRAARSFARAAASDPAHAAALGEAMRMLPAVARARRPLPEDVERAVRTLEVARC